MKELQSGPASCGPAVQKRTIDPQDKIHRVFRTGRRLFVERGFYNVSIPLIVKESGVSTGAIYRHFANKEALAAYIHQESLDHFHRLFTARLEGRTTTYERLRAFAEVVFEATENDPELMEYLLFMRHAEFMSGCAPICFTTSFEQVRDILRAGVEAGDLNTDDIFVAGIAYTGTILRAAQLRLHCVVNRSLLSMADELIATAWRAIRA